MNIQREIFLDAKTASALLTQLLGPRRFQTFVNEARTQLRHTEYVSWSAEIMTDHVSAEMSNPYWRDRKPSIADFQNMVEESRRKCREFEIHLHGSHARMAITRAATEDDFDFAKLMLQELLDYFAGLPSTAGVPLVNVTLEGSDRYSQILVAAIFSGVCVDITFMKVS